MTIGASDVVAPVFSSSEVVSFLFACVASKARLRDFLRRFILERYDFCRVSFLDMSFSWPMTCLTSCDFVFPTIDFGETGVGSMGERLELVVMAVFAGFTANIITVERGGAQVTGPGDTANRSDYQCAENGEFDQPDQFQCLHPESDHVAECGWKKLSILTVGKAGIRGRRWLVPGLNAEGVG